ncbi:hypothetical protein HYX70_01690 [Candidatus Saccharibacteria bacterium]|nr:hypothetical protein [Candidatus Saccharibacteria bacterium]
MPAKKKVKTKSSVSGKGLKAKAAVPVWMVVVMVGLVAALGVFVVYESYASSDPDWVPQGYCKYFFGGLFCRATDNGVKGVHVIKYGPLNIQYVCPPQAPNELVMCIPGSFKFL